MEEISDWHNRTKIFLPSAEGSASDSDPLGSGLKYWRTDILNSHLVTAADSSLISLRTASADQLCTRRVRAPALSKYPNRKMFQW